MPWFRIDDGFSDHPKVRSIPRTRRLAAVGLWSLAGSWSAKHSTDGVIPGYMIEELAGTKALAAALVECGLWHRGDHACPDCPSAEASAFVAHAFTERNPSRAQVERDRRAAADRQAKSRDRKRSAPGDSEAPPPDDLREWEDVTDVSRRDISELTRDESVSHGPVMVPRPDPTRPDPFPPTAGAEAPRPDTLPVVVATSAAIDTADDEGNAGKIVGKWIERCKKRPPEETIARVGKAVRQMLSEGIDRIDVWNGVVAWADKGLAPSSLPSVVNEVMNAAPDRGKRNGTPTAPPPPGSAVWEKKPTRAERRPA